MEPLENRFDSPWISVSNEEAQAGLLELAGRVRACFECSDLAKSRHHTVFGVGHPSARVVFIGEAPGFNEDQSGEPFVGEAGELLTRILGSIGLKRDDVYICNVLKCRPPQNRKPLPQEVTSCRHYLMTQLRIIRPQIIVCLGSTAAYGLLGLAQSVTSLRGKLWNFCLWSQTEGSSLRPSTEIPVLCTYHPAYLLRQPAAKKEVWDDMKRLREYLNRLDQQFPLGTQWEWSAQTPPGTGIPVT